MMKTNKPIIFALELIIFLAFSAVAFANSAPVLTSIVGGAKEKEPFDSSLVSYWDMDKWGMHFVNDSASNDR